MILCSAPIGLHRITPREVFRNEDLQTVMDYCDKLAERLS